MKKLCVALTALAIVMFASSAFAGLVVNVTAMPGSGYDVSADGKTVTLQPGTTATVMMQVWATLSGTNGDFLDEKLQTLAGGIQQTHVLPSGSALQLTDAVTKGYLNPFDSLASSAVNATPDLLGTAGATNQTNALAYRAATAQVNTSLATTYALGTFKFQAVPQVGTNGVFSRINFVKAGSYVGGATFVIDGATKNGLSTSGLPLIEVGAPVACQVVIPEPSTIILLGMGALALAFIRRRK